MEGIEITPTGKVIKEYLLENRVSQKKLAAQTGYTEKQISLILNGKANVSEKFAFALEQLLPGTKASFWLKYDKTYRKQKEDEAKLLEQEKYKEIIKAVPLNKLFANSEYSKIGQITFLKKALGTNDILGYLAENKNRNARPSQAFLKDKREDTSELLNLWIDCVYYALEVLEMKTTDFGGKDKLIFLTKTSLKYAINVTTSDELVTNLRYFCEDAGINLFFTKNVPTTYVRGMSFKKEGKYFIVLTDRYKSIEYTLFAFIHELMHIINGDIEENASFLEEQIDIEERASRDALEFIFEGRKEAFFGDYKEAEYKAGVLVRWSNALNVTPGLLLTILQHNGLEEYSANRRFLNSFSAPEDLPV